MNGMRVTPPPGHGALEMHTLRSIMTGMVAKHPGRALAGQEPEAAINGVRVPFGWGKWYYPLPPGRYEITAWPKRLVFPEERVSATVEIREGLVTRLDYACSISTSKKSVLGPAPQPIPDPRTPLHFAAFVLAFVTVLTAVSFVIGLF